MGLRSARYPDRPEFITIAANWCGTQQYAPVEVLSYLTDQHNDQHNDQDIYKPAAADIWALGIVLYEMVSGIRAPFRNPKMAEEGLKSVEAKFGMGVTYTPEIKAVLPIVTRCLEVSVSNRVNIDELMGLCSS